MRLKMKQELWMYLSQTLSQMIYLNLGPLMLVILMKFYYLIDLKEGSLLIEKMMMMMSLFLFLRVVIQIRMYAVFFLFFHFVAVVVAVVLLNF